MKRWMAWFLAAALALAAWPAALAAEVAESGICGVGVTYQLDADGLMEITGEGDILGGVFAGSGAVRAVIGEGVTGIGDNAFAGCAALKEIVIPDSVTHIGSGAFLGCAALETVRWPAQVKLIADNTFAGCVSLQGFSFAGITEIGENAFLGCASLRSVAIPAETERIGAAAFLGCTGLREVTLAGSETDVGGQCFANCPIDTVSAAVDVLLGSVLTAPEGMERAGWVNDTDGIGGFLAPNEKLPAGENWHALWQTSTYPVTYDAAGGSGAPAPQQKTYGVALTLSGAQPVREGYVFAGWQSDGVRYQPGSVYEGNAPLSLQARWREEGIGAEPQAITGLTAQPVYTNAIRIQWDPQADITGYQVFSGSSADGEFTWLKNALNSETINYALSPGQTYYYKVRAFNELPGGGREYGPMSEAVSVVNLAPVTVTEITGRKGEISISWTPSEGCTGYQVFYTQAGTGGNFVWLKNVTEPGCVHAGLAAGVSYYYRIRAYVDQPDGSRAYSQFSEAVHASAR